jgi:hypothetical protein
MLLKEIVDVYTWESYESLAYKMQDYWLLKHIAHVVAAGL